MGEHHYAPSLRQWDRLAKHPRISGRFALDKNLWDGRKVCVVSITRGNFHRATERRLYYGTLVLSAGDDHQIGVRDDRDGHVSIIHQSRAVDVYDLTREKAKA